jgi:hypothetical protein
MKYSNPKKPTRGTHIHTNQIKYPNPKDLTTTQSIHTNLHFFLKLGFQQYLQKRGKTLILLDEIKGIGGEYL